MSHFSSRTLYKCDRPRSLHTNAHETDCTPQPLSEGSRRLHSPLVSSPMTGFDLSYWQWEACAKSQGQAVGFLSCLETARCSSQPCSGVFMWLSHYVTEPGVIFPTPCKTSVCVGNTLVMTGGPHRQIPLKLSKVIYPSSSFLLWYSVWISMSWNLSCSF